MSNEFDPTGGTVNYDSIAKTGGDYGTLALWEDATDLSLASNSYVGVVFPGFDDPTDAADYEIDVAIVDATNIDATHFRMLRPVLATDTGITGTAADHGFAENATTLLHDDTYSQLIFRASGYNGTGCVITEEGFHVHGMQLRKSDNASNVVYASTGANIRIRECIFEGYNHDVQGNNAAIATNSTTAGVYNCLAYNLSGQDLEKVFSSTNGTWINCAAYAGTKEGFQHNSGTNKLENCWASDNVTQDIEAAASWTSITYTATSDATAQGTGAIDNITLSDEVESITTDFRIKSTSPNLKDGGMTSATVPKDIFGTVRPVGAACDIGPYQTPAAGGGGGALPPSYFNMNGGFQ